MLRDWSTRTPQLADPKVELARLSQEFGDLETAKQSLIEAVAVAPNNARASAALGMLREQTGETDLALSNYARALASNPNQPQLAARVAQLQAARGNVAAWPTTPTAGSPQVAN